MTENSSSIPEKSKITIHRLSDLTEPSRFRKLKRVEFTEHASGKRRFWDFSSGYEPVIIIIYNRDSKKLVFVKQFRVQILMKKFRAQLENQTEDANLVIDRKLGETFEFCGGLCDKNGLSKKATAVAEVEEETGYHISENDLENVTTIVSPSDGSKIQMYYVEVSDDMRKSRGGGVEAEGEYIEVVEMTVEEARKYFCSSEDDGENRQFGECFGMLWFLANKHRSE